MEDSIKRKLAETRKVACKGEGEKIGHPLVFLNMGEADEIDCPYCNTNFFLKKD